MYTITGSNYVNLIDFGFVQQLNNFFEDEFKLVSNRDSTLVHNLNVFNYKSNTNENFILLKSGEKTGVLVKIEKITTKIIKPRAAPKEDWFGYMQYGVYLIFLIVVGILLVKYGRSTASGEEKKGSSRDTEMSKEDLFRMEALMSKFEKLQKDGNKAMEQINEEDVEDVEEIEEDEEDDDDLVRQVNNS